MIVLVLGSGGREHAFTWKLNKSNHVDEIFVAPGNAGTSQIATNVKLDLSDFENIGSFIKEKKIDMVVVGPEQPLVEGICDYFQNEESLKDISVIGPSKKGA